MTPRTWQLVGLGLNVVLGGVATLTATGKLDINMDQLVGAWYASVAWYIGVTLLFRSRFSFSEGGRPPTSIEQAPEVKRNFLDPWSALECCKKGELEYAALISLCESQIEKSHANSAACLAWLYDWGPLETRDHAKANELYKTAALLGHPEALDQLIRNERHNARQSVMTDEQKSAEWKGISDKVNKAIAEVAKKQQAAEAPTAIETP